MRLLVRRAKHPHDRAITGKGMTDQGGGPEAQRDARQGVPAPTPMGPTLSPTTTPAHRHDRARLPVNDRQRDAEPAQYYSRTYGEAPRAA